MSLLLNIVRKYGELKASTILWHGIPMELSVVLSVTSQSCEDSLMELRFCGSAPVQNSQLISSSRISSNPISGGAPSRLTLNADARCSGLNSSAISWNRASFRLAASFRKLWEEEQENLKAIFQTFMSPMWKRVQQYSGHCSRASQSNRINRSRCPTPFDTYLSSSSKS